MWIMEKIIKMKLPVFKYVNIHMEYINLKGGKKVIEPKKDEKLFAAAIYAISYFTAFIGPIVIWVLKKDESSFVDFHGRQYLNFLFSYIVYFTIAAILIIILIGLVFVWLLGILQLVFTIVAAIKAFEGKEYEIPFVIRFLRYY